MCMRVCVSEGKSAKGDGTKEDHGPRSQHLVAHTVIRNCLAAAYSSTCAAAVANTHGEAWKIQRP